MIEPTDDQWQEIAYLNSMLENFEALYPHVFGRRGVPKSTAMLVYMLMRLDGMISNALPDTDDEPWRD